MYAEIYLRNGCHKDIFFFWAAIHQFDYIFFFYFEEEYYSGLDTKC